MLSSIVPKISATIRDLGFGVWLILFHFSLLESLEIIKQDKNYSEGKKTARIKNKSIEISNPKIKIDDASNYTHSLHKRNKIYPHTSVYISLHSSMIHRDKKRKTPMFVN